MRYREDFDKRVKRIIKLDIALGDDGVVIDFSKENILGSLEIFLHGGVINVKVNDETSDNNRVEVVKIKV